MYLNQNVSKKFILKELDDTHLLIKDELMNFVEEQISVWINANSFVENDEDENKHMTAK